MGRPRSISLDEIDDLDEEQIVIRRERYKKLPPLTTEQILEATKGQQEEGVKITFPTETTWEMTINFADMPWYPKVKANAQAKGIALVNKKWTTGGNTQIPIKDVVTSANILVSYRQNFGSYHRAEFEQKLR